MSEFDFKVHNQSWCTLDRKECQHKVLSVGGFALVVAGMHCNNCSPMGPQSAADGAASTMTIVFVFERRTFNEDAIILEKVPASLRTLLPLLERFLGHLYCNESLIASPNQFGWPMLCRPRARAFILPRDRQTLDRVPPFNESLVRGFNRSTLMCGNPNVVMPSILFPFVCGLFNKLVHLNLKHKLSGREHIFGIVLLNIFGLFREYAERSQCRPV